MLNIKIKAVLWKYRATSKGEFEIRIRMTQYKEVCYLNTGFASSEENWDYQNELPRPAHKDYKDLVNRINFLIAEIEFEAKTMKRGGIEVLPLKSLKEKVKGVNLRMKPVRVLELFNIIIRELNEQGRIGYSNIFASGKCKPQKYLKTDKTFWGFSKDDFEGYERYLRASGLSENTMCIYIRTFNRLWNIAIKREYCPKDHHPSKYFTFKAYRKIKTKSGLLG